MNKILFCIALLLCINLHSQEFKLPEIFPAAPTSSELGKFGAYPVNLSTGLPSITIPLYTVKSGDLSVPIALKYHASGIRVNQTSSWVGLGWSLDVGGMISLGVRDTPDELESLVYNMPDMSTLNAFIQNNPNKYNDPYIKGFLSNSRVKDAYQISLPTVNGSFFLDSDISGNVSEKFPPDEFLIDRKSALSPSNDYYYKITDKAGTQYFMKDVETSRLNHNLSSPPGTSQIYGTDYKSAWLLNKILNHKGHEINFIYNNKYSVTKLGESHSQSYTDVVNHLGEFSSIFGDWKKSASSSTVTANKPQEIQFRNGRVRFVLGNDSQYEGVDGANGKYLDKIIVEKGNSVDGFTEIKTIHFTYSITGLPTYYTAFNQNKYRFKLDRVYETYGPSIEKDIADFEYSTVQLPNSKSYAIDYFGMHNGKSNTNLIPERNIVYGNGVGAVVGLADRSIDVSKMMAGMLTKITHPTKGSTSFEYEPNSFYGKNVFKKNDFSAQKIINLLSTSNGSVDVPEFCLDDCGVVYGMADFGNVVGDLVLKINGSVFCTDCGSGGTNKYAFLKLIVYQNNIPIEYYGLNTQFPLEINISNGGNIKVFGEAYGTAGGNFNISYRQNIAYMPNENVQGFGLRIKKITNHDHNATFVNQKEYVYNSPNSSNSSGKFNNVFNRYDNINSSENFNGCNVGGYSTSHTYTYSSSSKAGFENNSISYEYVTEFDKDSSGDSKGKTVYKYTTTPNEVVDAKTGSVWMNLGNKRGLLLSKKVFDKDDNLIVKERTTYLDDLSKVSSRSDFKMFQHATTNVNNNNCLVPSFSLKESIEVLNNTYSINWYKNDSTEVVNYFYDNNSNLTDSIKVKTNFLYNANNQEITTTKTTNSTGDDLESQVLYAHDLADQTLINENRISIPLSNKKKKNNFILSDKKTTYSILNGKYLPNKVYMRKGDSVNLNEDLKFTFKEYDSKGNLIEYVKENGTPIVVIWGYKEEYPIAKIENSTYSVVEGYLGTVSSSISNLQALSNADNDHSIDIINSNGVKNYIGNEGALREKLAALSDLLPKEAQMTFYTYDSLVGVTSITDPRGQVVYYHYDIFNRLEYVTDEDGKVLNKNEYYYKN